MTEPGAVGAHRPSRGQLFGAAGKWLAGWSVRILVIFAALLLFGWIVGKLWTILLPIVFALVVATVLWPPVRWMRSKGVPPAAATALVLLLSAAVLAGIVAAIAPSVVSQSASLAQQASSGLKSVEQWINGPPLNVREEQITKFTQSITDKLQASADSIASGVFTGVSAAGSAVATFFVIVILLFFFLKDGDRFAPWLGRAMGSPAGPHVREVLARMWRTLGGFIRTQALVSFIDAFFIGLGLVLLDVPLAYALAVLTFVGGFIPIVGAVIAGAVAVLVALVSKGVLVALAVLGVVIAVQQLEGNLLQPWLQSKSMNLHAAIVLLAVSLGGSAFGIIGAFLAVPVAACGAVLVRYLDEQIAQRTGEAASETTEPDTVAAPPDPED